MEPECVVGNGDSRRNECASVGNLLCVGPTKPLAGAVSFNWVIGCKVHLCTFHSPAMQSRRNVAQSPADTPCGVSEEPGWQAGASGAWDPGICPCVDGESSVETTRGHACLCHPVHQQKVHQPTPGSLTRCYSRLLEASRVPSASFLHFTLMTYCLPCSELEGSGIKPHK